MVSVSRSMFHFKTQDPFFKNIVVGFLIVLRRKTFRNIAKKKTWLESLLLEMQIYAFCKFD